MKNQNPFLTAELCQDRATKLGEKVSDEIVNLIEHALNKFYSTGLTLDVPLLLKGKLYCAVYPKANDTYQTVDKAFTAELMVRKFKEHLCLQDDEAEAIEEAIHFAEQLVKGLKKLR